MDGAKPNALPGASPSAEEFPFRWMLISDRHRMGPDPVERAAQRLESVRSSRPALQWREKDQTPLETHEQLLRLQSRLESRLDGLKSGLEPRLEPRLESRLESGMESRLESHPEPRLRSRLGSPSSVPLIVNDRVDIALALSIHVHLTESSLPTREARRLLPKPLLVGRSTHSLEAARQAEAEGADYILFGPVFSTPSKQSFGAPQGLDALERVCAALPIPVIAVGGVEGDRVESVRAAGAHGWASIRAAWPET